ncbi:MAG TPA: PilZ domain-containing protein [Planctomycetota bacterium]|nr:PilZ domain-containing protein [Planctomycetota bacterium]
MPENRRGNRRKGRRVIKPVPMLVFWIGKSGRHTADICDVSHDGCYLNTTGTAAVGERISIELPLSVFPERIVTVHGTVVPQNRKFVGFGVHFDNLTEEQEGYILRLMMRAPEVKDRRATSKK